MATYEVSAIAIATVKVNSSAEARRELARRLDEAGVQYYIMDNRRDDSEQGSEHKTGQHEGDRG